MKRNLETLKKNFTRLELELFEKELREDMKLLDVSRSGDLPAYRVFRCGEIKKIRDVLGEKPEEVKFVDEHESLKARARANGRR